MGRFDNSEIDKLYADNDGQNVRPAGLVQAEQAGRGFSGGEGRFAQSAIGELYAEQGPVQTSSYWFTGANRTGEANGWDTEFMQRALDFQDSQLEAGTAARMFEDEDATGVVTWDHDSADGREHFAFGDIFDRGKKVGNIYDQPKELADELMTKLMFDGTDQARIFSESDPVEAMARAVEDKREQNNATAAKALGAQDFQAGVDAKAQEFSEGKTDEAIVGGAAAGGALTGAAAGFVVGGPVGAAAGGLIGGAVGLFGGLSNKDELTEQAARASEITRIATEENGRASGIATGIKEWAGFSTQLTSPLTQASHGLVELTQGDPGDGESAFYATDETGKSKRPLWAKPLSLGAALGDGLLQFVSPLNRAAYAAQMGGSIGGESVQIATSGEVFDPRRGGFDNIFLDDDGNPDPVSAAAGLMKVGIDAVQVTGMLGLARQSRAARKAIDEGGQVVDVAGHKFVLDAAGNVTKQKRTLTLLAPSEQVASANAWRKARVAAAKEGRAVTADDFYAAATSLATGSNRLKAALVNGFGEGYEEFVQSILEPLSVDGRLAFSDMADAFMYGTAAGAGMGLGATHIAPSTDERLKARAYAVETVRNGGVELDQAEFDKAWETYTPTEKRVLASRTEKEAQLTAQALQRQSEHLTATLLASNVDAAKAIDANRSQVEKELRRATVRSDQFVVLGGLLDAGRVDVNGERLGDTIHPEAVAGSALTIARLLDQRLSGIQMQQETLENRADPDEAELLAHVTLTAQVGEQILRDVLGYVDEIYDENSSQAEVQAALRELNTLLEGLYNGDLPVAPPEGSTATVDQLTDAAQNFVTLLASREPKLDTGSYLALLPYAKEDLTFERADNLLQVNTDVLQAINGDFDGDKLRAENQLILSPERFAQTRAGSNFAGAGDSIDIAARKFDPALAKRVGEGLVAGGVLQAEAEGTMRNIETAITRRYGQLMSAAALRRVLDDFRTSVRAGSESARTGLLNSLAHEAGEAIVALGKEQKRNEWLWAAHVVRANFEAYQRQLWKARALDSGGPTAVEDVADVDTPKGTNRRKDRAVNTAQTLALFAVGNSLFRKFQKVHYTSYNAAVLSAAGADRADLFEMAELYEELSRGVTRSEIVRANGRDTISSRVLAMLARLVEDAMRDPAMAGQFSPAQAMTVLANVKVKDVAFFDGEPVEVDGGADLSLVQLLLRRALEADREEHKLTFDTDEKLQAKHARLRSLTRPNRERGDVHAERAFLEVFGGIQFADSLGGSTGALAAHTTPEQWLRQYLSLDEHGRRQMERAFENVPEYLDRKEHSNLPYSFAEASRREVSPYRSMLDAMLAVGRTELTFDGKKLGGRRYDVAKDAMDALVESHTLVREAIRSFRTLQNRRSGKRAPKVEHVQELFEANPDFGRQVLDLVPDAEANALYEYRDGQLYVAPWIYEMFTIENSREALFFYWKNLTLTQWNATLVNGRKYDKLNSRFQRLMYQLAQEPGQPHLELLLRKMDKLKDLDEFFVWLNRTPGFRGEQAPFVPFNDDVADFEADAGGSWVTSRASMDLREAIATVRRGAERLRDTMRFRAEREVTDRRILDGIKLAHANDPAATTEDRENLRKLEKAIAVSRALPRGFAPSAMLALTQGMLRGFDAHSTDKGVAPDSYRPLGEFQALMDAFGFVPELERVMEVLTAHSISSLQTNVGDLAKHNGTAMDAHGRQVEWTQLTVDDAIAMLDDSRTAPLAYALLTPKALDLANGKLSERLLFDASLKDLLNNDHYADLFHLDGDGALNNAMQYLYLIDSRARAEGGHFDVIRYASALAAARTSGLTHEASESDLARLRNQAYLDTARMLQLFGQVQATGDQGVLESAREAAVKYLRETHKARRLAGFTGEEGLVVEAWVNQIVTDLESERLAKVQKARSDFSGAEQRRQIDAIDALYDRNRERIENVLVDDQVAAIMERFRITGDPAVDQAAKVQITEYVVSTNDFPARAPESAGLWSELADARLNGTQVRDDFEWDTLSRSVMGVYLTDEILRVASHVSIPPFPKNDPTSTRFFKFFDPAYTWIATDLLDETKPILKAAEWFHTIAGQPRMTVPLDKLQTAMRRTILNDKNLGTWTPGLMSQIVEGQTRMDSAPGEQGIAQPGNGPKRWAAIAAATRANAVRVPDPTMVSTVSFSGELLSDSASPWNEIPVTHPHGDDTMPVAQLDNRFVRTLRINGTDVPLNENNLGYRWHGEDVDTGYRYVALPRLQRAVQRYADAQGKQLGEVVVELDFFHPDARPAGPEWMHNVYFDGRSHSLLPDGSESLIGAFWSDNGGLIGRVTQQALDASKTGTPAIKPFVRPDEQAARDAENKWPDLAALLRAKTELAMARGIEPSYYNAVYKMISLHHLVMLADRSMLTAEEYIARRAAGETLEVVKLIKLSPDVLRSMVGETGDQGVPRFFAEEYLLNPDLVGDYTHVTEAMREKFGAGWAKDTGSLVDTPLVNAGMQRALTVRTQLTDAERDARQERIRFLNGLEAKIGAARYAKLKDPTEAKNSYKVVLGLAMGHVLVERNTFGFQDQGLPIAPRMTIEAEHTARLLETMRGAASRDSFERGWMVSDDGVANYPGGSLTVESLDDDRELEHQIAPHDIVLLSIKSFEKPERDVTQVEQRIEKALRYLVDTGATIALGSGNGRGDNRDQAYRWLREHGYAPVGNSRHLLAPVAFVHQTQNERAYESTLVETRRVRPYRNIVTFLAADPIGPDENTAALNPASVKLRDRKLVSNILPSTRYQDYNLLLDDERDSGLYARTLAHLRGITDPSNAEARAVLVKMAGADPKQRMPIEDALDRFHAKLTNSASLLPEVGQEIQVGDILPLVHPDGHVVLYRHGFKPPMPELLRNREREGGLSVSLAESKTDPDITANSGTIVAVEPRPGFGKTLAVEVPLQPLGDKIQLEWNGMKYVVVPPNETLAAAMSVPLFANGTVADLFSDKASADSKEAYEGRIHGYRNALAFFQYDFTDDLVEFFFPDAATRDPAARTLVLSMLDALSKDTSVEIPVADADILAKASVEFGDYLGAFAAAQDQRIDSSWTTRLVQDTSVQAAIARAMVTYLLTPGAELENVIRSAGFSHRNAHTDTVETRLVPGIFAELLDQGLDSPLHAELIRRFDAQLTGQPGGAGWRLHPDWSVSVYDANGHEIRGYLQFGEAHSSGDNPTLDGQAFDPNEDAGVSPHNAMAAFLSLGAITAHKTLERSKAFAQSFTKAGAVNKLGPGESLWQMLTALPNNKDTSMAGWRREQPAETLRRSAARDEIVGFYQPLETDGWGPEYEDLAMTALGELNLVGHPRALVDVWVRDQLGRPQGQDDSGVERGNIIESDAIQAVKEILRNIRAGQLPHAAANVPLIDVNHLTTLYLANAFREDGQGWAPIDPDTKQPATSWDQWVEHAFGTAFDPEARFDSMYLLAVDGRMHGYQGATTATRYLPVSSSVLLQHQLIDPDTNRMVVSISSDEQLLATDPTLFATAQAQLEDILSGQRIYAPGRDGDDPQSAKGRQRARIERWRKDEDVPRQVGKTMRGVRKGGQTFIQTSTKTSALFRSWVNLRAGNALFNPALWISAVPEAFYKRTINSVANAAVGESTGALGRLAARVGVTQRYTPDQLDKLNDLVKALSQRSEFKAMVYQSLMYQYPTIPGIGRVEKWLERYAKFGARMQDPAWGMLPQDLARIYVETVMRRIAADPTGENIYSVDRMLVEMADNPEWLSKQDAETHDMAIAAIAQIRSIKPNVLGLATRGIIEPLSENPRIAVNATGNMLKMLTMFQNFWASSLVNMTGMQGVADWAAFALDGRQKSKLIRRMQAALAGRTFVPEENEAYDMTEVLEGLDLADSFIRGGITHTALFALGMMAGSLGLSGDDEEEKWRRRQAELQGAGLIKDPLAIQNDFRNKGAIYLGSLPLGLDTLFTSPENPRGMFQMNWVMRYFTSPIIGFERFYETGDFSEVIHGFGDALGAHPIVNTQLWNEAVDTAAELHAASNDAIEHGDEQQGAHLLITAVGILERMVMENSFVNMLYVGTDRYDRDPYVLPRLDSDGNQQVDVRGNPYKNQALHQFVNDDGQVQEGYITRDQAGAELRALTENRFGLALATSLWNGLTGGQGGFTGSDTLRQNMAVKVRKFELMPTDRSEIENLVLGNYALEGGQPSLTEGEAAQIIKREFEARGEFWDADEVETLAKVVAAQQGVGAMSVLDGTGREVLTPDGARAVFNGLRKKSVRLSDPSLQGIYIDGPTRDKIRDEMAADLVQEGVDLGLSRDQATWRMRRIMFGTNAPAGSVKLIDLIYTDQIPFNDTLEYNQLNTTYVLGPDGMPMATGFTRDGVGGAFGVKPLLRPYESKDTGLASDSVLNTVDNVAGVNLGMRALEARPESWEIPSIEDITEKGLKDVLDAIEKLDFSPSQPYQNRRGTGYGYGGYRRFGGYRRRGGGYYSGGGGYPNFTRMYALPQMGVPYGNNIPFINTTNPIIRRADVRRERVWSERGRLKQWQ